MRILVVDDKEDTRDSLALFLTMAGHDVVLAPDGVSALAKLVSPPPVDALIVDQIMPRMSGMDLVREAHSYPPTALLPVAIVTGVPSDELATLQTKILNSGSASAIELTKVYQKPTDPRVILQWFESVLGRRSET